MSVLGAYIIHYGKEYFKESLESIKDNVDEIVIFYTARPSHGTITSSVCPDTREELKDIANQFNCTWFEVSNVIAENKHRQMYIDYGNLKGYDQILIVDSDEIHVSERISELLQAAKETGVRRVGVMGSQWLTPWKSFNEYVTDGFSPIRVMNLKSPEGEAHLDKGFIYHMGYCISNQLMEYKISCHGHRADFEKNNGWFKDKWLNYKKGETRYLHPATDAYWVETNELDKTTLPEVLKTHPKYEL